MMDSEYEPMVRAFDSFVKDRMTAGDGSLRIRIKKMPNSGCNVKFVREGTSTVEVFRQNFLKRARIISWTKSTDEYDRMLETLVSFVDSRRNSRDGILRVVV